MSAFSVAVGASRACGRAADRAGALPLLFVMEKVLGHATQCDNLRRAVEAQQVEDGVESRWAEVSFWKAGGWLERPWMPWPLRGALRGWLQAREGWRGGFRPAAQLMNTNIAAFFPGRVASVPTVLTTDITPAQYDRMADLYAHRPDRPGLRAHVKRAWTGRIYRSAVAFAVWSEWCKRSFVEEYGVDETVVHVIPPGVDLDAFPLPDRSNRRGPVRILFVGGHFARKGGELLLSVFRRRLADRAELHLVTRDPVPAGAEEGVHVHHGLGPNDPRLMDLLAEADVFCLPTLGDCYSVASIEAMAAGLPVITTTVGGIPDIVDDGASGCLLQPGDEMGLEEALVWLVTDRALRLAMGRAGRERAAALFDQRVNAGRTLDLLKSVARQ